MTVQTRVSVYRPVFVARDYDVLAGLDVDHHSIAATFTDHDRLMQSLRLPYSARQLLNYVRKQFAEQRLAFAYEAGPTGFGLYDELVAAGYPCLVVAPSMVPTAPGQRVKTNRLDDLPDDPHLKAVDFFQRYEHPDIGGYVSMRPPVKFSKSPSNIRRHPPKLGEHTDEVLAEVSEGEEA